MARDFTTPLSRVRRRGAAHEGVGHFIGQRVSSVAHIVLSPLMWAAVLIPAAAGAGGVRDMLSTGWGAILTILFFSVALYHMRLGLQVVIEDYVHRTASRVALLLLNAFVAFGLWAAVTVSVLKFAVGG